MKMRKRKDDNFSLLKVYVNIMLIFLYIFLYKFYTFSAK